MTGSARCGLAVVWVVFTCASCPTQDGGTGQPDEEFLSPVVETRFAFGNLSQRFYAAVGVRENTPDDGNSFVLSPLMPPGAIYRVDFRDLLGTGCPGAVDVRLWQYRRIREDLPIGLDEGEQVEFLPIVAGELSDLPVCDVEPLVTYTIIHRDAAEGTARVKIAQGSTLETDWAIDGVLPTLANQPPPPTATKEPIGGRVALADGSGVAGIGVLLRTFFRVRDDDSDPTNDPDSGYSEPISFTETAINGAFSFDRPAGAYQIEFFSDAYSFRPSAIAVESPIGVVQIIAEGL